MAIKKGLVHTVFFWLKNPKSKKDHRALHKGLKELAKISLIKAAYVGTPAPTNRPVIDSSYHFSISFVFATAEDQDAYQTHPDHYKFIDNCSALWEKVLVYDAMNLKAKK